MPAKFHVAICGGGIGGLAAAVALSRFPDIEVSVFEAAKEFTEVGAGIGVWPRVWKLLAYLGLDDDLASISATKPTQDEVDTFIFRKADQPEGLDFYKLRSRGTLLRYHRPDVLQVLIDNLPAHCKTYFNRRLQTYTQDRAKGTVQLVFSDGSTETCNVLIGSDGIKSSVRRTMLTNKSEEAASKGKLEDAERFMQLIEPTWTGIVAYRALIPTQRLQDYKDAHPEMNIRIPQTNSTPIMYMGQHINVVVYPISSGKLINIGAFHAKPELAGTNFPGPWVETIPNDELLAAHDGWEPELQAILRCAYTPSRWAVHMAQPLESWVDGNVALLGDSAHAMSPQQASGAGQAIEDAYLLATLLGHRLTRIENINQVLNIYSDVRVPVATEVQHRSLVNGSYFGLQLEGLDSTREHDRLHEIGDAVVENWNWAWATTLDPSISEAVKRLEASQRPRAHL
ncbi:FAD/NAD(P)-binding domain-containing protein [Ephemerocybe angulata]|uniref:FAD/NAD(P)-binding domain-containing protein n=1 Tax=Ephemerocybe angulata TaxID=980116 RepID=A0A8H6M9F2_9AGAR|nr:FAD/NAD(P)-binding domain-containing protein [Tulosesus angulatus]